jgi:histidine triad (HIT) family protein
MAEESIFTKIMNGEIPADIVFQDDDCICIKDISPKAPVHVLLIPRKPIPRLVDATAEEQQLLGKLMVTAGEVAKQLGVGDAFRLIINNGEQAGQTVFHLHLHILGGKNFTESSLGF